MRGVRTANYFAEETGSDMTRLNNWIANHKFEAHLIIFLLMTIPSVFLYFLPTWGATIWIMIAFAIIICANILAIFIK